MAERTILGLQKFLSRLFTHWAMALDFRIEHKEYEIETRNKTFPKEWFGEDEYKGNPNWAGDD